MKTKLFLLALVLLVLPATRPLFNQGFFTMHDDQQIVRLYQMDKALASGQFPVRWVGDLGFGYGYPLFNFYPPFIYYLAEVFLLLFSTSYITAIKLVFGASFMLSALTMFLWSRKYFGDIAGVIAALFYVYAPYRAVDAYVRGALAEAFSFVWLPLILLSIDQLAAPNTHSRKNYSFGWVIVLALSYAALMITHNLIVLPFTLLMLLYCAARFVFLKKDHWVGLFSKLAVAGILGLALSAFFWLPALSEMQYTLVDEILLVERYDHSLHYVEPTQLWNSLWGYGGSSPDQLDGFSLKIGKLHVVMSAITVCIVILGKFRIISLGKKQKHNIHLVLLSGLLFGVSAWMTTRYSSLVWDTFTPIQFLQFPWRFLSFTTLFSSILVGASVWCIQQLVKNKLVTILFSSGLVVLLFLPNLKLFNPQIYLDVDDTYYTSDEFTKWHISKTSFEFVPKGVETTTDNELGITQLAISEDQIATSPYQVTNGQAQVEVLENTPHKKIFDIQADTVSLIEFNTFNFPGWQLSIDGTLSDIHDENRLKLISGLIGEGNHRVEIEFVDTPVRTAGNFISSLAWIVVLGILTGATIMKKINK